MSSNPVVLNPVTMNPELDKAIRDAIDPADIRTAIFAEAAKQTNAATDAALAQAATDKAAADKAAADAAAATASAGFSRTETIGGKEFTFEGASELEVERMINNAYKVAYAVQAPEARVAEVVVDPAIAAAAAQKAAEDEATLKAELELKFKRGEINAADYIEQSGAMKDYLAKQGVPLDALRNAVTQSQETAETQSWADATKVFLNSPAGSSWPGGDKNLALIGDKLAALGLTDAEDKVAALAQAYEAMKTSGTIFPYEPPAPTPTNTAEQVAAGILAKAAADKLAIDAAAAAKAVAAAPKAAATSSSLFGASSGGSGATGAAATASGAAVDIPKEASPAEIMDAWKKATIAAGQSPDTVFTDAFRAHRM